MKIFRIFLLTGFLMVSGGTSFGADSIQKLFNIMQEKLTKYQRIMSDVKSSAARKLQAAKDYTNAKTAFETSKAAYSRISPASAPNSDPTTGIPLQESFDNLGVAIEKISSKAKIKEEDLDLKFPPTRDNSLELKMGEDFWQNVTRDIKNASSSIHIQMFGMEADKTGWEFARLLAEKAKSGVEVFLVADRSGARMMGPGNVFKTTEEEKLFKFYKDL